MRNIPLLGKTLAIYSVAILLGTLLLVAKNVWVHGLTLEDLAEYFFGAIAALNLVFMLFMQAISHVRLRGVHRYFRGDPTRETPDRLLARLLRFPAELFWSMIAMSAVLSVAYHGLARAYTGKAEAWLDLLGSFLSEQALAVTLAVMVYSLLRTALRPYLQRLQPVSVGSAKRMSTVRPLTLCYVSCFVVIGFDVLRNLLYAVAAEREVDVASLTSIAFVDLLFSLAVFTTLLRGLRKELRGMASGIRSLTSGHRSELRGAIRIGFPDELGLLAEAFNAEQRRADRRFDRLDEELALAVSVQQMLLPERECRMGGFHILAEGRKREAAGEWYDIVPVDGGRFAVVAGIVLGRDLPGALAMSAALVWLRSEIRRGSTAVDALRRLLAEWADTLPADMRIHMGIAVIEPRDALVQAAVFGSIRLEWVRQSKPMENPLRRVGHADGAEAVQSGEMTLRYGDRVTIAVEASAADRPIFGDGRAAAEPTKVSVRYSDR